MNGKVQKKHAVWRKGRRSGAGPAAAVLLLALLLGGCGTGYRKHSENLDRAWVSGNVERAAEIASRNAESRDGTRDEVVWHLEKGATLRAAGNYEESNAAFEKAESRIREHEEAARVRVGRETGAALTNLAALPYEGFAYDRIMLSTYQALNYLQLGDYENARVAFNRAQQRQREAVQRNARRLEEAREEARQAPPTASDTADEEAAANTSSPLEYAESDRRFQRQLERSYSRLDGMREYADYVNPLTVYLEALFFMAHPWADAADLERALMSIERVASMIEENEYIRKDLELIESLVRGERRDVPALTYVIFETGVAPVREEIIIDIPLWGFSRSVPYVGAAFPTLRFRDRYEPHLTVLTTGEGNYRTSRLASMDSVIAREFKNELPVVVAKTLAATTAQASAQYAIRETTREAGLFGVLAQIGGVIYQFGMNRADTRSWKTLPKEFQFARFPTPEDRTLTVSAPFSPRNIEIELEEGIVNVVHIKSISRGAPLHVKQFKIQ